MMVQEKNIRERDYNEALFTLDVFNNRELSPCCPQNLIHFDELRLSHHVGLYEIPPKSRKEALH